MYLKLFLLFLELGFVSIGGGYPMMALILQEGVAVGLTAMEFADMAALELLASGPIAINAATYIGYIKGGVPGAIIATLGVCVSPFILTSIVYFFFARFKENKYVQGFLAAIKITCGAILCTTAVTLARGILLINESFGYMPANLLLNIKWGVVLIVVLGIAAILKWKVNPIFVILGSALLGAFLLS